MRVPRGFGRPKLCRAVGRGAGHSRKHRVARLNSFNRNAARARTFDLKVTHEIEKTPCGGEVADYHTYYISESQVLVHNTCVNDALSKAKIDEFTIKDKHLNSTGGQWSKFNVGSEAEVKAILKETLANRKILQVGNNAGKIGSLGQKSFNVLLDAGKVIGTRGESSILMILDEMGNIWTAFPK